MWTNYDSGGNFVFDFDLYSSSGGKIGKYYNYDRKGEAATSPVKDQCSMVKKLEFKFKLINVRSYTRCRS